MSYPAPTLHIEPTGGIGELFIRIEGELRPVQLMYMIDDLVDGGNWVPGPKFPLPGLYRVSGFADFIWYTFTALHVNSTDDPISPPSNPVKSRPEFQIPTFAVDLVREDSVADVPGRTNAYRSRIQAWPVRGVSAAIFLYKRELFGAGAASRDVFIAMCKPGDLTEYPEGDVGSTPYYRLDYVDLIDRAADYRAEDWIALMSDAAELIDALELEVEYGVEDTA